MKWKRRWLSGVKKKESHFRFGGRLLKKKKRRVVEVGRKREKLREGFRGVSFVFD